MKDLEETYNRFKELVDKPKNEKYQQLTEDVNTIYQKFKKRLLEILDDQKNDDKQEDKSKENYTPELSELKIQISRFEDLERTCKQIHSKIDTRGIFRLV